MVGNRKGAAGEEHPVQGQCAESRKHARPLARQNGAVSKVFTSTAGDCTSIAISCTGISATDQTPVWNKKRKSFGVAHAHSPV